MSVIYVLLAISIAVAVLFFVAFIISVKNGQYDDSYTPSVRMLFEDELVNSTIETNSEQSSLHDTKRAVESHQTNRRAVLTTTNNKNEIQLNKQE